MTTNAAAALREMAVETDRASWDPDQPRVLSLPGRAMVLPTSGDARDALSAWTGAYPLPNSPTSAAVARTLIRQALVEYPTDTIESAELLASELVTNAVLHAQTGLVLHIQVSAAGVRVTVEDASGDSPSPVAEVSPDSDERGRGLQIVNALASSWGWDRLPTGKRVWFELQ